MKPIKIAQIGTSQNSHGSSIFRSLCKQSEFFEVVGYALPEGEREKFPAACKAFEGYREMTVRQILSDPEIEAVAVETEEIYLTKYALMVAEAGKHLHMEKPGSPSFADFARLVDILREKKLAFTLGYMYRFNPMIQRAIEMVESGALGEIYAVEAQMNCKHPRAVREWLSAFPGGMLFFLGCHLIDLIYRIQGEPSEVIPLSCATDLDGVAAEDYGMAVFRYPHGVSFAKTTAMERGGFMRRQLVICGERGTYEIKPLEVHYEHGLLYTEGGVCAEDGWSAPFETVKTEPFDRYDAMMKSFAEIVRGKPNPYSYEYELGLFKLIMRACGGKI